MCRKIRIRQKQSSIHLRRVFSVFKIGKRIICNIHSLTALNQEKTFVAVKQLQFRTSSSNSAIVRVHCEGSLWGFMVGSCQVLYLSQEIRIYVTLQHILFAIATKWIFHVLSQFLFFYEIPAAVRWVVEDPGRPLPKRAKRAHSACT